MRRVLVLLVVVGSIGVISHAQTPPAKVLASVEGRWEQMFCDLTDISRSAPNELMVRFRYRNLGKTRVEFPLLTNIVPFTTILDTDNRIVHNVLKDTTSAALSSTTLQDIGSKVLPPGGSQSHWAKIDAPPAATTRVTVLVPACMPMEAVAIGGTASVAPMTAPRPAIASQDGEVDGMKIEVVELSRAAGGLVNVIVRFRNQGPARFSFPHLSDQISRMYLVDAKNRRKYTVALDPDKHPLASSSLFLGETGGQGIPPGAAMTFWAKIAWAEPVSGPSLKPAEPPSGILKPLDPCCNLTVPGAPPFDNLTIAASRKGGEPVAKNR